MDTMATTTTERVRSRRVRTQKSTQRETAKSPANYTPIRRSVFFFEKHNVEAVKQMEEASYSTSTSPSEFLSSSQPAENDQNGLDAIAHDNREGEEEEDHSAAIIQNKTNGLKDLLARRWHEKQMAVAASNQAESELSESQHDLDAASSQSQEGQMHQDDEDIATVRKESVFEAELTETEQDIIRKRVALQQRKYEEFRNRKLAKVRAVHPYNTLAEISCALREVEEDENEAIARLTEPRFLQHIRKVIAFEAAGTEPPPLKSENRSPESEEDEEEEQRRKRKKRGRRPSVNADSPESETKAGGKRRRVAKLRLDDALAKQTESGKFEGWSEARIRAFKLIGTNPNAYYYRFNDPGVTQKNGPWSPEEVELFRKRKEEIGVNGQWGIFSMVIPGRVGYQCSNYYRHLVESGQVIDENYVLDAKGKAHFKFRKGFKVHRKKDAPDVEDTADGKKKKRKGRSADNAGSDDDTEYRPPPSRSRKAEVVEEEGEPKSDNPLPGFVDPITLDEVEQPAISPSGHVMSYSSWSRCLMNSNVCPLTKQPLKKRDLVILTWDNIDQYINRIANA